MNPQLYDPADRATFKVEHGGQFEDLPREAGGTAIIADPRNDENLMIAGLQAAFLLFHNRVVDKLREDGERSPVLHASEHADGFRFRASGTGERRSGDVRCSRRPADW